MDMNTPADPAAQAAETVPCVHLYSMPDGTFKVTQDEGPAPTEGQDAATIDEAVEMVRQMASAAPEGGEEDMAAAQAGYAKAAQPGMGAPNPGGLFGEG